MLEAKIISPMMYSPWVDKLVSIRNINGEIKLWTLHKFEPLVSQIKLSTLEHGALITKIHWIQYNVCVGFFLDITSFLWRRKTNLKYILLTMSEFYVP